MKVYYTFTMNGTAKELHGQLIAEIDLFSSKFIMTCASMNCHNLL